MWPFVSIILSVFTEYLETFQLFKGFKYINGLFKKLIDTANPEKYFKNWLDRMTPQELKDMQGKLNDFLKEINARIDKNNPLNKLLKLKQDVSKQYQAKLKKLKQTFTDELGGVPQEIWVGLSSSWVRDGMWVPLLESNLSTNVYGALYLRTQHSPKEYFFPMVSRKVWVAMVSATGSYGSGAGSELWAANLLQHTVGKMEAYRARQRQKANRFATGAAKRSKKENFTVIGPRKLIGAKPWKSQKMTGT